MCWETYGITLVLFSCPVHSSDMWLENPVDKWQARVLHSSRFAWCGLAGLGQALGSGAGCQTVQWDWWVLLSSLVGGGGSVGIAEGSCCMSCWIAAGSVDFFFLHRSSGRRVGTHIAFLRIAFLRSEDRCSEVFLAGDSHCADCSSVGVGRDLRCSPWRS